MSVLIKGGILMIPIAICSVVALTIIFERLINIRRVQRQNMRFLEAIRGRIRKGNLDEALAICEELPEAPLSAIFLEALRNVPKGKNARVRQSWKPASGKPSTWRKTWVGLPPSPVVLHCSGSSGPCLG